MILTQKNIQEIYKYIFEKEGIKDSQFDTKSLSDIDKQYVYIPIIYDTPEEGIKFDNGKLAYKDVEETIKSNILNTSTRLIVFDKKYSKENGAFVFYNQVTSKQPYYKIAYGGNSPFSIAFGNKTIDTNNIVQYQELFNISKLDYQNNNSEFGGAINLFGWNTKTEFNNGSSYDKILSLYSDRITLRTGQNNGAATSSIQLESSSTFKGLDIQLSTNDKQNNTKAGVWIEGKTANDILTAAGTTTTGIYDLNIAKNNGQPFKVSKEVEDVLLDRDLNLDKDTRLYKAYIQETNNAKYLAFCIKSYETVAVDYNGYYVSHYYFLKDILWYRKIKFSENGTISTVTDWKKLIKDGDFNLKTINGNSLFGSGNIQINNSSTNLIVQ